MGCCLLNFRCCCSILFVKISFFAFLRQVPHSIKHIFFSISYNTSNQHLNSRPRHLISGSSMLHNGTDGCCFFFNFLFFFFFFVRVVSTCFKFDITFTLDFLFIFFQVSNKVCQLFSCFSHSFCSQKTPNIKKFCSVFFISFRCCSRGFRLSRQKKNV